MSPAPGIDQDALILTAANAVSHEVRLAKLSSRSDLFEDATQSAWLGVCQAARKFKPSNGFKFSTFAHHRARGAVQDFFRQIDPLSRDHRLELKAAGERGPVFIHHIPSKLEPRTGPDNCCLAGVDVAHLLEITRLTPKERLLIELRFFREMKQSEIAQRLGICDSYASQIEANVLRKLRMSAMRRAA